MRARFLGLRVVGHGVPSDAPPYTYPASISSPSRQHPQVSRGPLRAEAESRHGKRIIIVGGYLDSQTWWRVEVNRPSQIRRWGPTLVRRRVDGSRPWSARDSDQWWAVVGPSSCWSSGRTEDGEWNVCEADGDFQYPYLTVNEIGTVNERRRRGLAKTLLDRVKALTGLLPIPEIVHLEEDEGLAVLFWKEYLPPELSELIERLSQGKWERVADSLRKFRQGHRREHDRIVFGVLEFTP
jgi:hypothetical protein